MANINLDNLNSELEAAIDGYRRMAALQNADRSELNSLTISETLLAKEGEIELKKLNELQDILKSNHASFKRFGNSVKSSLSSLTSGDTSIAQLATIAGSATKVIGSTTASLAKMLGPVGKLAGVAIEEGAEILATGLQMAVVEFDRVFESFKHASKTGVVNSFDEMRDTILKTNVRAEKYAPILEKHAQNLARYSGSSREGAKILTALSTVTQETRLKLMRVGIDSAEFADIQGSMMTEYLRMGRSVRDITLEQEEYIDNLMTISRLTGKKREAIIQERETRMLDFRYRAQLATMSPEKRKEVEKFVTLASAKSQAMGNMIMESIVNKGLLRSETAKADLSNTGGMVNMLTQQLINTNMDAAEAMKKLNVAAKVTVDNASKFAEREGAFQHKELGGDIIDMVNTAVSDGIEKTNKAVQEAKQDQKKNGDDIAKAANAMETSSAALQDMLTESKMVASGVADFANAVDKLLKLMADLAAGKDIGDLLADMSKTTMTRLGLAIAQKGKEAYAVAKASAKFAMNKMSGEAAKVAATAILKGGGKLLPGLGSAVGVASAAERAYKGDKLGATLDLIGAGASWVPLVGTAIAATTSSINLVRDLTGASDTTPPTSAPTQTTPTAVDAPQAQSAATPVTGKPNNVTLGNNANLQNVDPAFLSAFYSAAAEYGKPVSVSSAYRDDQAQAALWVRENIYKEPGIHLAALPRNPTTVVVNGQTHKVEGGGNSNHNVGTALDINPLFSSDFAKVLDKFNIVYPLGAADPPHIQPRKAKYGGVFDGPESGYPMELHGSEAVVPLPNGRSIPVEFKDDGAFMEIDQYCDELIRVAEAELRLKREHLQKLRN